MLRVFAILACMYIVSGQFVKRFEFENVLAGKGTKRIPWRSGASASASLHMFKGDAIVVQLCLPEATPITIKDLIYSNDGESDTLKVFLDNASIGTVNTEANSGGFGQFWNTFNSSGQVAVTNELSPGKHYLKIYVPEADCYGSEFDALDISLNVNVSEAKLWCGYELIYAENPTPCAVNIDNPPEPSTTPQTQKPTTKAHSPTQQAPTQTTNASKPTTQSYSPTTEASKPTTHASSPTTEASKPTTQPSSPTTEASQPTTHASSPTTEASKPTTQASSPTTEASQPTTQASSPTTEASKPTTQASRPTTLASSPAASTPLNLVETTAAHKEEDPALDSVQQLSFQTTCIDDTNVNIKFNPSVFLNTKIIAREVLNSISGTQKQGQGGKNTGNKRNRGRNPGRRGKGGGRTKRGAVAVAVCEDSIWQIGVADKKNNELGSIGQNTNINYTVDNTNSFHLFPGTVDPRVTREVSVKYYVPKRFNIRRGRLDLTLGLVNTDENVKIGLEYHNRAKRMPSDVEYETFTPNSPVKKWDFPARAVSPSLQNELTLVLDNTSLTPINIDYVRLTYRKRDLPTTKQLLANGTTWRVQGRRYRERKNRPGKQSSITEGMRINVGGVAQPGRYKKVMFSHKSLQNLKVLQIFQNGEIFVDHETRKGRRKNRANKKDGEQSHVSGLTLGNGEHDIASVDINSNKGEVTVNLDGGKYVKFRLAYSKTETALTVVDTNMESGPVSFFSTYISDASAAVTDIIVDGQSKFKIMDPSIDKRKGKTFKFVKNNDDNSFDVSDEIEFVFP